MIGIFGNRAVKAAGSGPAQSIGHWLAVACLLVHAICAHAATDDARAAFEREDYASALKLYSPRAQGGDAEAQYRLGVMYRFGWGVDKDIDRSVQFLHAAASQNHVGALAELGTMYRLGRGVPENPQLALDLLGRAAARGHGIAQLAVGRMYRDGAGAERHLARAWAWFTLAGENQVMDGFAYRGEIEPQMNQAQLAEARRLAAEWRKTAKETPQ